MSGRRQPLDRDRIVAAAMTLADTQGLEAVTMRAVGGALGVEAMSLYHHVASKQDLVTALLDAVIGEYTLPVPGEAWKPQVRSSAISANQVLQRHGWAPGALMTFRAMPGPRWLRWSEELLATLRRAGFSPELTHHAFHILESHIYGSALRQVNFRPSPEELEAMATGFLATIDQNALPSLVEHIQGHLTGEFRGNGFELGLDLILDGLERELGH